MAITEQAQKNHDELFLSDVSTSNDADPELIDVLIQLLPYIGFPRTLNVLRVIDEATPA